MCAGSCSVLSAARTARCFVVVLRTREMMVRELGVEEATVNGFEARRMVILGMYRMRWETGVGAWRVVPGRVSVIWRVVGVGRVIVAVTGMVLMYRWTRSYRRREAVVRM